FNFYNSTIAFNQALRGVRGVGGTPAGPNGSDGQGQGGGVFSNNGIELAVSTIFAKDTADDSGPDFLGDLTASACLFGNTAGTTIIPGALPNLTNVDPLLGPLA